MVSSRAEAKVLGLKQYYTGVPCKNGHISARMTVNSLCMECNRNRIRDVVSRDPEGTAAKRRERYLNNIDAVKAANKSYREANKDAETERIKRWVRENPEKELAKQRRWRAANLEKARAKSRNWHRQNPVRSNAISSARRARIKKAVANIPKGMSAVFDREIRAFYRQSKRIKLETGIDHDVDHIYPLSKGGVHAPWNMRVIPSSENRSRQDKPPVGEPTEVSWHGFDVSRVHTTVSTRN